MSTEINLPFWTVDVRNSYKISLGVADKAQSILGLGSYKHCGGKIEHQRIFDKRQAFFDFIDKCDKQDLPETIPLEKGYHGPKITVKIPYKSGKDEDSIPLDILRQRSSKYFLPRSGERYNISESFEKHPELYPGSESFLGSRRLY